MKRKVTFGAVITVLICVCLALNATIIDPADFTGVWYRADDGILYIFEDGLIECADQEVIILGDIVFSGAYSIAKDKAAIFLVDENGVGEVVELHLVHKSDGDVLYEDRQGTMIPWFYRAQDEVKRIN